MTEMRNKIRTAMLGVLLMLNVGAIAGAMVAMILMGFSHAGMTIMLISSLVAIGCMAFLTKHLPGHGAGPSGT